MLLSDEEAKKIMANYKKTIKLEVKFLQKVLENTKSTLLSHISWDQISGTFSKQTNHVKMMNLFCFDSFLTISEFNLSIKPVPLQCCSDFDVYYTILNEIQGETTLKLNRPIKLFVVIRNNNHNSTFDIVANKLSTFNINKWTYDYYHDKLYVHSDFFKDFNASLLKLTDDQEKIVNENLKNGMDISLYKQYLKHCREIAEGYQYMDSKVGELTNLT